MSQYCLKIMGKIDLSDYSKIYDYMGIVDVNDKFIVTLDNKSRENSDIIYSMLENNNFSISNKGGEEDGEIYITASKNRI